VFYALRAGKPVSSPFQISIQQALGALDVSHLSQMDNNNAKIFVKQATSVMFVREPFARLLSGYTDKLFAPNPYFWGEIGQHIIKTVRLNSSSTTSSNKSLCGHDVSFPEFIDYVIQSETLNSSKTDEHFSPMYNKCDPCIIDYKVIGKMESFSTDVAYTLGLLVNPVSKESIEEWSRETLADAIYDSIYSPFGWKPKIQQCMTWYEALRRIWRKLQIRGIILLTDAFPWQAYDEISYELFIDTVNALHDKTDKQELKNQKLYILAHAYSLIELEDIQSIVNIFKQDFELFQYSTRPNFIFEQNIPKHRHIFSV